MESIRVTEIQHFSVNDGEGIRSTVFLAGCPLRCAWCSNPETWEAEPDAKKFPPEGRRLLGRSMTVDEILEALRRQSIFHRSSSGGVTWSGGEPFSRPDRLRALVKACAAAGIDQAVESSAQFDWEACSDIVENLNFLFLDLKHIESDVHRRWTGLGNETILANLARIGAGAARTVVRIPLVAGVNDGEDNLRRSARFVLNAMRSPRMEVLPYHWLGKAKYEALGLGERFAEFSPIAGKDLARAEAILEGEGIEVVRYR